MRVDGDSFSFHVVFAKKRGEYYYIDMKNKKIFEIFRKYQKLSQKSEKYQNYLRFFEEKMIYRTTKTENPEVTLKMVKKVLSISNE